MSTSSKNSENTGGKISIGYVSAAHGVRGEIRVVPLTDFPERFGGMDVLDLYADGGLVRKIKVVRVRKHESKNELIVESDISDREEAQRLVGTSVLINPEERVALPEDSFWVDDLIGLLVVDEKGSVLGVVEDLLSTGGKEIYKIKDEMGEPHYIPAVDEFVKKIDLVAGRIDVKLIEGLW